jgi:hypothetical protein
VSIVVHNSYIKQSMILRLKSTIEQVVPERLLTKQDVVDFQWN